MIYELAPSHYAHAAPLYRGIWERAAVEAVLTGRRSNRCFIYADDPHHPTSALVAHVGNYYLGGEPSAALLRFIMDEPAETRAFAAPYYAFYAVDERWERTLEQIAPARVRIIQRRTFRREAADMNDLPNWRILLPPGASVHTMTRALAERTDRELHDQYIGTLWTDRDTDYDRYSARGYQVFIDKSFGVAMLLDGRVVSSCWAFGISDSAAAAEVETAERYRGRGLATLTCWAWLEVCRQHGMASEWIADADNLASVRLALRLEHTELRPVRKFIWRDWGMEIGLRYGMWRPQRTPSGVMWSRKA
jgi:GNAT superfamily N-acetyltransferase